MMSRLILAGVLLSLVPIEAQALNTRTWISGHGIDQAGCGVVQSPCRTLQYAHDNTAAGGEIDVLDPAGYGSVVIHKAISVVNDGVGLAGVLAGAGSNGITINAGPADKIVLRGLTIEGAGVGANGVVFANGGGLTMSRCVVEGFVSSNGNNSGDNNGDGILIAHSTGAPDIVITDTQVTNNSAVGIYYQASRIGRVAIDGVTASGNNTGIALNMFHLDPGITRTYAASNGIGIYLYGGNIDYALLENVRLVSNGTGVYVAGSGTFVNVANSFSIGSTYYGIYAPSGHIQSLGTSAFDKPSVADHIAQTPF